MLLRIWVRYLDDGCGTDKWVRYLENGYVLGTVPINGYVLGTVPISWDGTYRMGTYWVQ